MILAVYWQTINLYYITLVDEGFSRLQLALDLHSETLVGILNSLRAKREAESSYLALVEQLNYEVHPSNPCSRPVRVRFENREYLPRVFKLQLNKICLGANRGMERYPALKEEKSSTRHPILKILHRKNSSKDLDPGLSIPQRELAISQSSGLHQTADQTASRTLNESSFAPKMNHDVKQPPSNPHYKVPKSYIPSSSGKINWIKPKQIKKPAWFEQQLADQTFQQPLLTVGRNKSYSSLQGIELYSRFLDDTLVEPSNKLQSMDYAANTKKKDNYQFNNQYGRQGYQIDEITARLEEVVKGCGVVQNYRTSVSKKSQQSQSTAYSKPLEEFQSPLKMNRQRVFSPRNKKYSYSSYYDKELYRRSSLRGPDRRYCPRITLDSEPPGWNLSCDRREHKIESGNKAYFG